MDVNSIILIVVAIGAAVERIIARRDAGREIRETRKFREEQAARDAEKIRKAAEAVAKSEEVKQVLEANSTILETSAKVHAEKLDTLATKVDGVSEATNGMTKKLEEAAFAKGKLEGEHSAEKKP